MTIPGSDKIEGVVGTWWPVWWNWWNLSFQINGWERGSTAAPQPDIAAYQSSATASVRYNPASSYTSSTSAVAPFQQHVPGTAPANQCQMASDMLVPNVQHFGPGQVPIVYNGTHYQSPPHFVDYHSQGNYSTVHYHSTSLPPSPNVRFQNWPSRENNFQGYHATSHGQLPQNMVANEGQNITVSANQDFEELNSLGNYVYASNNRSKREDTTSALMMLNNIKSSPHVARSDSYKSSSGSRESLDSISTEGLSTPREVRKLIYYVYLESLRGIIVVLSAAELLHRYQSIFVFIRTCCCL